MDDRQYIVRCAVARHPAVRRVSSNLHEERRHAERWHTRKKGCAVRRMVELTYTYGQWDACTIQQPQMAGLRRHAHLASQVA